MRIEWDDGSSGLDPANDTEDDPDACAHLVDLVDAVEDEGADEVTPSTWEQELGIDPDWYELDEAERRAAIDAGANNCRRCRERPAEHGPEGFLLWCAGCVCIQCGSRARVKRGTKCAACYKRQRRKKTTTANRARPKQGP
jgi:hypothetical protein